MRITGPDWPSTRALQEALQDFDGPSFAWGQGGKNGLQQLQTFTNHGVGCPTFTTSLDLAKQWVREGKQVFGRNLHHTQGKDIVGPGREVLVGTPGTPLRIEQRWITTRKGNRVQRLHNVPGVPAITGGETWNPKWVAKDFWVQVITIKNEFRQHVFGEKGIRRGMKVQTSPELQGALPIRSRRRGWHINYGPFESPRGLRDLGKAAVAALGYTHGAVDIIEDMEGRLYVLEVNSAPSVEDTNTLKVYVDAIKGR